MTLQWAVFEGATAAFAAWLQARSDEGYTLASHTAVVRRLWLEDDGTHHGELTQHVAVMRRAVQVTEVVAQ